MGALRAAIDFSVNGSTVTREIYVENTASLRLHVGPWRIAEGAVRRRQCARKGYATEVPSAGVSLGSVGGNFSISVSDDLWSRSPRPRGVPGMYVIGATQLQRAHRVFCRLRRRSLMIEMGTVHVIRSTSPWMRRRTHGQERFAALATACLRGGETKKPCATRNSTLLEPTRSTLGEISGDHQREGLHAPSILVTTGH